MADAPFAPVVDLVALGELCDGLVAGDPSDRSSEPRLVGVHRHDGELSFVEYGVAGASAVAVDLTPPPECCALVLFAAGWAAPSAEGAAGTGDPRPSLHPDRRRVFTTTVIGNDGDLVTVVRLAGDPEPLVLTGDCAGRVPSALRAAWARRGRAAA